MKMKTTIVQRKSEHDYHEIAGRNGKMYGYEITQKVKAITAGELNITEGALYPALQAEAEGILDVEIEKGQPHAKVLQTNRSRRKGNRKTDSQNSKFHQK
jgi:DNA-binding PadR family transcriptional regulator